MTAAMDSIEALVFRLLRGAEIVMMHPETLSLAKQHGEPIKTVELPPLEESLDKLFETRKQKAFQLARDLPPCPTFELPLLYLYDEIRQCILFGLDGTAITLCGILLEFALKYAIYLKEHPGETNFDSEAWERFEESLTLRPAINQARRVGLLDETQANQLHDFTKDFRNTYSHFNIQKITKGATLAGVKVKDINTGTITVRDLPASHSPALQILAKAKIDEAEVFNVFRFVDDVVNHLYAQVK
jgi:hypothetical protein